MDRKELSADERIVGLESTVQALISRVQALEEEVGSRTRRNEVASDLPPEQPYEDEAVRLFKVWLNETHAGTKRTPRIHQFNSEVEQGKRRKLPRGKAEEYVGDLKGDVTALPDPEELPMLVAAIEERKVAK